MHVYNCYKMCAMCKASKWKYLILIRSVAAGLSHFVCPPGYNSVQVSSIPQEHLSKHKAAEPDIWAIGTWPILVCLQGHILFFWTFTPSTLSVETSPCNDGVQFSVSPLYEGLAVVFCCLSYVDGHWQCWEVWDPYIWQSYPEVEQSYRE